MIVRVNAVLNRTAIDVSTTCAVWLLIVCQSGRDVIGYEDSYCYWCVETTFHFYIHKMITLKIQSLASIYIY